MSDQILKLQNIVKKYPGVVALNDVSFTLKQGEVHALMGENGAGKSTLMKIIDGMEQPDKGEIFIHGTPCTISCPKDAMQHGIAMIHQELNPVLDMTIYENLFLGRELSTGGFCNKGQMIEKAKKLLQRIHLDIPPQTFMRNLSVAMLQMVEIAKAISLNARIIIMDEPTSAIPEKEVDALFEIIRQLKKEGVGIIYISHKMNEVFQIADTITVLRDGQCISTKPASQMNQQQLIQAMVGRELSEAYPKRKNNIGKVVLQVDQLGDGKVVKDVSFSLHRGEILGIAGLMGSGRTELVEALFGIRSVKTGNILINGLPIKISSPADAIRQGMALVTEDRKQSGLNLKVSIRENISLTVLSAFCHFMQFIDRNKENAAVDKLIEKLSIKAPNRNQIVNYLSGGNQQKVILAKWLLANPCILILDEPTRGIDILAKSEIYHIMNSLVKEGCAILMVSSEMPEIIGICDRVLVMNEGTKNGELEQPEMTQENIMSLASGVTKEEKR